MNQFLIFLFLVALGNQDEPDISHLVEKLADEQIVVRDEAERQLIELGSSVIGRLEREAGAAGEEVRARIEQVILLIHREERSKRFNPGPSLITLAREEINLKALFSEISGQVRSDMVLRYSGVDRPVSVGLDTIPVFEAIDRICREDGNLDYSVYFTTTPPQILVSEWKYSLRPKVFHEQFMIWIDGVHITDRLDFGKGAMKSGELTLKAVWEPDTIPVSLSFRLDKLQDEKGKSLLDLVQTRPFLSRPKKPLFVQRIRFQTPPPKEVKKFSLIAGELVVFFPRDTDLVQFQAEDLRAGARGRGSTFEAELLEVELDQGNLHVKVKIIGQVQRPMPKMVVFTEGGVQISGRTMGSQTTYGNGISWQTFELSFKLEPGQKPAYLEMSAHKGQLEKLIPVEFRDVPFRP